MFKTASSLLVLGLSALSAYAAAGARTDDAKLMQGVWVPVSWTLGGSPSAPSTMPTMKLIVKRNEYEFIEGPTHDFGHCILRAGTSPKAMDLVGARGPNAGKTIPTIYKLENRKLIVCYGLDGHRPKEFNSPKKSMVFLVVFARPSMPKMTKVN